MTGRRSAGARGDAPLWRDERDGRDERGARREPDGPQDRAAADAALAHPVPAQRGPQQDEHQDGHRDERRDEWGRARRGGTRRGPAERGAEPGGSRRAARRGAAAAPNRMPAVLPALGLPVLGALADELVGSGLGGMYAGCAVLGAVLAGLVSSPAGWWWVVSGAPVVTLAAAGAAEFLAHGERYHGAGLATEGLKLISGQFPWMLAALGAALLAVGVRVLRARRSRRG